MEEKERLSNQSVPLFRSWEEVITAYTAGLMPVVCRGNPDRFMDYTALMLSLITEHAKGEQHWPIFLRYIESRRREVLQLGAAVDNAEAVEARRVHRLTVTSPQGGVTLDEKLLQRIEFLWANRSRLFEDEFVDPKILNILYGVKTASEQAAEERHRPTPTPYNLQLPTP